MVNRILSWKTSWIVLSFCLFSSISFAEGDTEYMVLVDAGAMRPCQVKGSSRLNPEQFGTYLQQGKIIALKVQGAAPAEQLVYFNPQHVISYFPVSSDAKTPTSDWKLRFNANDMCLSLSSEPSKKSQSSVPKLGEEYSLSEEELKSELADRPALLAKLKAIPYFQEGKSVGLRVFAIRLGSAWEKMGLLNGDILKAVDSSPLVEDSSIGIPFDKLLEKKSVSLTLERNKEDLILKWHLNWKRVPEPLNPDELRKQ
jgi:hypothetical protein